MFTLYYHFNNISIYLMQNYNDKCRILAIMAWSKVCKNITKFRKYLFVVLLDRVYWPCIWNLCASSEFTDQVFIKTEVMYLFSYLYLSDYLWICLHQYNISMATFSWLTLMQATPYLLNAYENLKRIINFYWFFFFFWGKIVIKTPMTLPLIMTFYFGQIPCGWVDFLQNNLFQF